MKRAIRELLEQSWPVDEPSAGFAGRVVQRALTDSRGVQAERGAPRRRLWPASRASLALLCGQRPRRHWFALALGFGLALAALLIWGGDAGVDVAGEFRADQRRQVAIGERAIAVLEPGASIRWRGLQVTQDGGDVVYQVERGSHPFQVLTPLGRVEVLGTRFRVLLQSQRGGNDMKPREKALVIGAAGLGVIVSVSVYEGKVRLYDSERGVELRAGESGVIDADGVRAAMAERPLRVAGDVASPAGANPARRAPPVASPEQMLHRQQVLESLRARERRKAAAQKPVAETDVAPPTAGKPSGAPAPEESEGVRVINEEFMPLVNECFDMARERNPTLQGGVLAIGFTVANDEDLGGIIESLEPKPDANELDDPEMIECVRQSAFSLQLPAKQTSGRDERGLMLLLGRDAEAADSSR